jgi:hypothetical protein
MFERLRNFIVRKLRTYAFGNLTDEDVEWVVNDIGELGVKIGDGFYFLYKGDSLVYKDGRHDNGEPMKWRPVGKREFGEVCYPIAIVESGKFGHDRYEVDLLGRLGEELPNGGWKPLPAADKKT